MLLIRTQQDRPVLRNNLSPEIADRHEWYEQLWEVVGGCFTLLRLGEKGRTSALSADRHHVSALIQV